MSSNRYYTLMIIPEKTAQVKRLVVPAWLVRGTAVGFAFLTLLAIVMVLDYWYVMSQITENKQLKIENRRLRQQVQVFNNKFQTIENTMERVKTFATRLKVITNLEDEDHLLQTLNQKLPDASSNVGGPAPAPALASRNNAPSAASATPLPAAPAAPASSGAGAVTLSLVGPQTDEDEFLRREYGDLDRKFTELNTESLYVEQELQDEYELLADQKAFLAALPTRKPAVGYFTSGFGVRTSPFGGRVKMHEGLDIANRAGTPIKAPADGAVVFADSKAGYGQTVILDHGYGLQTLYGHTKKILVTRGQKVKRGDTIALMGSTGRSTGPHVHYEVRVRGTPVDPLSYILEN